ncbi:hypothetical protein [Pseudomonas sp. dw_358]|uniref:hypothetical protein n=1 Tax=Pseudomonas sp. dw_358 TaxID=2720083 RepID=UPI002116DDE0|nr:hypothetical protein [Pseudomonas sp. dw_358]
MIRPLLPVLGALFLCAQPFAAFAADSPATATTSVTPAQLRQQIEAKRDQLSGVASVATTTATGAATVLDTPVQTDDTPTQVQQP